MWGFAIIWILGFVFDIYLAVVCCRACGIGGFFLWLFVVSPVVFGTIGFVLHAIATASGVVKK